jgi:predicted neuraminidase
VRGRRRLFLLALLLAAFGAGFHKARERPPAAAFQLPPPVRAASAAPFFESRFVSTRALAETHAASLVELGDGSVRAFWFSGSREGASDVEIRSARFDPVRGQWSAETTVATRQETQRALWRPVKKLGNPVAARDAQGVLRLFYVTVSLGGWAGSSLSEKVSHDDGATWSAPRRLVTSPFLNVSTLVKGPPFGYADGTLGLPAYHEFITKFGLLLRLDADGTVIDAARLAPGGGHLQPVLLVQGPARALVLMRHSGAPPHQVVGVQTQDAGAHWSALRRFPLSNPDSALSALVLPDGRLLAALNDTESGREVLSLAISADGGESWRVLQRLEDARGEAARCAAPGCLAGVLERLVRASQTDVADPAGHVASALRTMCRGGRCGFEYSYPYLLLARNGDIHLVYTWNRAYIKHVRFNLAWLEQRAREAE